MRKIRILIPGKPTPLKRHRHHNNQAFDPQKKEKLAHGLIIKQFTSLFHPFKLFSGPIHLEALFYFKQPRKNNSLYRHLRPDLDNLIKYICDVMNNIIYHDDSQICSIEAQKYHTTKNARTEITIHKIRRLT